MKKIIYRISITFIVLIVILTFFLSTIGITTNKLNSKISNQIKNINKDLNIKLEKINLVLKPFQFKINANTIGTDLLYKDKKIKLKSISSQISIVSLIKRNFSLSNLYQEN